MCIFDRWIIKYKRNGTNFKWNNRFNSKKYICFKVIEFEGEVFTYFVSESKPIDIKFTKQIFKDNKEPQLEIIGDFYEKEKALSLLENSKKDE